MARMLMNLGLCFYSLILAIYGKSIVDNLRSKYDIEQIDGSNRIEESNLADKKNEEEKDGKYVYTLCDEKGTEPDTFEIRKEEGTKEDRNKKQDKFTYTVCDEDSMEKSNQVHGNQGKTDVY
ncbi:hypothetical protein THOM_0976 [Trachipleistophora hominis]|uniref:Uncharacterized protein n=1 Tax=Trachipleistophora hominis TaxID=72359 RepID=L7JYD8_TRAHO|nr:hypothetical protein THOM_0976 [Trachipleistophora hominis]